LKRAGDRRIHLISECIYLLISEQHHFGRKHGDVTNFPFAYTMLAGEIHEQQKSNSPG
jgi:hypothetical protein